MTNNTALLLAESSIWTNRKDDAHLMKYSGPSKNSPKEPTSSENDSASRKSIFRLSFYHFSRSTPEWNERCVLLADTPNDRSENELFRLLSKSKQCTMLCFLRTSEKIRKGRLNPLHGNWISVAKTPRRCIEHVANEGSMSKKSFVDYYSMDLGDELNSAGKFVSRSIYKMFSPIQKSTERYIDSWKNGDQQVFFYKFWNSLQKGDAFYLVRDSTKRLIGNALDKKPSDKK